jgi:hypothetical protein
MLELKKSFDDDCDKKLQNMRHSSTKCLVNYVLKLFGRGIN